jgi:hypothetical protein
MAQRGAKPGGEHRGHAAPVDREHRVPDCIDAPMHAMQPPRGGPVRDRPLRKTERGELPRGDDPVLGRREGRDALIDDFQTCGVWKSSFACHAPRLAGKFARVTPRS